MPSSPLHKNNHTTSISTHPTETISAGDRTLPTSTSPFLSVDRSVIHKSSSSPSTPENHSDSAWYNDYFPSLKTWHGYFTSSSSDKSTVTYYPQQQPPQHATNHDNNEDDVTFVTNTSSLHERNTIHNDGYEETIPIYSDTYGVSSSIARTILRKRRNHAHHQKNTLCTASNTSAASTSNALSTLSGIISKLMDHRPDLNPFSSIYTSNTGSSTSTTTSRSKSSRFPSSSRTPVHSSPHPSDVCLRTCTLSTTGSPLLGPIHPSTGSHGSNLHSLLLPSESHSSILPSYETNDDYTRLTDYARDCARKLEQANQDKVHLQEAMHNLRESYENKFTNLQASYRFWKETLTAKEQELFRKEQQLRTIMDMLDESRTLLQSRTNELSKDNEQGILTNDRTYEDNETQTDPTIEKDAATITEKDSFYYVIQDLLWMNSPNDSRLSSEYIQYLRLMIVRLYDRNRSLRTSLHTLKLLLRVRDDEPPTGTVQTNTKKKNNVSRLSVQDQSFLVSVYNDTLYQRIYRSYYQQVLRNTLESTVMDIRKYRMMIRYSSLSSMMNSSSLSNHHNGCNISNGTDSVADESCDDGSSTGLHRNWGSPNPVDTKDDDCPDDNHPSTNPSSKSTAGGASILSFRLWHDFDDNGNDYNDPHGTTAAIATYDAEDKYDPASKRLHRTDTCSSTVHTVSRTNNTDYHNKENDNQYPVDKHAIKVRIPAPSTTLPVITDPSASNFPRQRPLESSSGDHFSFQNISSLSSSSTPSSYTFIPSSPTRTIPVCTSNTTIAPSLSVVPLPSSGPSRTLKDVSVQTDGDSLRRTSTWSPHRIDYPSITQYPDNTKSIVKRISLLAPSGTHLQYSRAAFQGLLLAQQIEEESTKERR